MIQNVLSAVLLELPLAIVQWADLPSFEPAGDAMEVEGMVADAPCYRAILGAVRPLIRLALNAQVHDVITTDRAVVHNDVPSPQRHGIPFLDLESLRGSLPCRRGGRFLGHCTGCDEHRWNRS